jgi:hypothetical protein
VADSVCNVQHEGAWRCPSWIKPTTLKRLDLHESSGYSYSGDFVASSDPLKMFIDVCCSAGWELLEGAGLLLSRLRLARVRAYGNWVIKGNHHWRSIEALCSSAWDVITHCNSSCSFSHFVLSCNTPSSEPARIYIRSYSTKQLGSRLILCFVLFCSHAIFMETCSFYTLHRWPLCARNCAIWRIVMWLNPPI